MQKLAAKKQRESSAARLNAWRKAGASRKKRRERPQDTMTRHVQDMPPARRPKDVGAQKPEQQTAAAAAPPAAQMARGRHRRAASQLRRQHAWRYGTARNPSHLVLSCLVLSCLILSCLVLSYHVLVLSCLISSSLLLSCAVLSYLIVSYLLLSCPVLSYLILSCLILSYLCLVLSCLVPTLHFFTHPTPDARDSRHARLAALHRAPLPSPHLSAAQG